MQVHFQETGDLTYVDLEKTKMAATWMTMKVANFSLRRKKLFFMLLFFVSQCMDTSVGTNECANQLKRVYKGGEDDPLWEKPKPLPDCLNDLKSHCLCQYDNRFFLLNDKEEEAYIFEGTGEHLNTITASCPAFPSKFDSQKDSSQRSHSWNWAEWLLIIALIGKSRWLLIQ